MGCDWVAVRNLTIALGVLVGLATSSAIFALEWNRLAPPSPWKAIVTAASFGSAGTWSVAAIVLLAILMRTVASFCACAAALPACAFACRFFTLAAYPLLVTLLALMAACFVAVADQELFSSSPFKTGVAVMIGMIFGLMGFVAYLANMIVTCQ